MAKILVVDDDFEFVRGVSELLSAEGHMVEEAYTGRDGLQLLQNFHFDVAVLDWNLPDLSGIEILNTHRRDSGETLILFLTGEFDVHKKAEGLNSGADDYLTKPFQPEELLARVGSLLRRPKSLLQNSLIVNGMVLDRKMRTLRLGSKLVSFARMEFLVLEHLMANPNQIFSSKDLFETLWTSQAESSEQTVRVHVRIIRKKISTAGFPDLIQSAAGGGWFIAL